MPTSKKQIVFITGGARSGKSSFALKEASKIRGRKALIATAEPLDEEMKERIERHKKERGRDWDTFEEPLRIADAIRETTSNYKVTVIDCLTLWLSNIMHTDLDVNDEIDRLIESFRPTNNDSQVYIVSNEVGMGIVPDNELARKFRDFAGILNREVAELADAVYLIAAGIPLKIK